MCAINKNRVLVSGFIWFLVRFTGFEPVERRHIGRHIGSQCVLVARRYAIGPIRIIQGNLNGCEALRKW
jgi:hypothetical protein